MTRYELDEYVKCAMDPVYFINTYGVALNITKEPVEVKRIKCFPYQEEVLRKYKDHRNNIVLKSRQCLPAGTYVNTPNGEITIEKFSKGDSIFSYNFNNNTVESDYVSDAWCSGKINCLNVYFNDSRNVEVGENHPFWVINKNNWIAAKDLEINDEVLDIDLNIVLVKDIQSTGFKLCYDISVSKNENFFINGLLVHNTGLSVITAGFVVWTLLFKNDQSVLIIANDRNGAVRFLTTVKQFLNYLPRFLLPTEENHKDNETEIVFAKKENGIVKPANKVKAVAAGRNAGRGETPTLLIMDEAAFIENADSIWTAASPALSATKGKCIMISTPFGTGNLYHKTWVAATKEEGTFKQTSIHWTQHPVFSIGMEEKMDEYGRMYWTSPWYEAESEKLNHDRVKISQELDLSFEGSRALVIESHLTDRYKKELTGKERPPLFYNFKQDGSGFTTINTNFWIWKKPEINEHFIISADVGRGDGADYSTIQILNAVTLEQVGEYQGKIPPDLFASIIYKVAMEYNKAYVVIECNSFGLATCLTLKNHLKYDYRRIYHSKSIKKLVNHHFSVAVDEDGEIPGFQTTKDTRTLIIAAITSYVRESKIKINSIRLLTEFETFIYNNTKAEHAPGFHDDLIIALGIGLVIRDQEFQNVFHSKDYYKNMLAAISYSNSNNSAIGKESVEEEFKHKAQEQYRIPDTSNKGTTNDDDLRWLLGNIISRE